jgi:hypothetical protein
MSGIAPEELQGLRQLKRFNEALSRVSAGSGPKTAQERQRREQQADYLRLFLMGVMNPVVRSMRGLCAASRSRAMQERTGLPALSKSSFSEMQHLVDPSLLEKVFKELAAEAQKRHPAPEGQVSWRVVDSSVFDVLNRMEWAYFQTHKGKGQCAIRLHVSLDSLSSVPMAAKITPAKTCERAVWKSQWEGGNGEIGDRNYSQNYGFLRLLGRKKGWFILRLREKQTFLIVEEELPLSQADQKAGVSRQAWARLGKSERTRTDRLRVIWIKTDEGEPLLLVTNQGSEQMPAALVSAAYRHRWQIELFFRWIKCLLQCRHFLAESPRGVAIQLYLVLIGAVLLQLHLGQRPCRRVWEALQFYFLGFYTEEDMSMAVLRYLPAAKKS